MDENWQARQAAMEAWYRDFSADPGTAANNLLYDYRPYIGTLESMQGAVLDIGGGAGLTSVFLPSAREYVVLEPSPIWRQDEWESISARFGEQRIRPQFVTGVGEDMPFADGRFDVAVAFWSLNHAMDPRQVMRETHRVLKPGGRAFVVLEDVEPRTTDVLTYAVRALRQRVGLGDGAPLRRPCSVGTLLGCKLARRPWPVQEDHVPVTEAQFAGWVADGFDVIQRSWAGGFLSFDLRRR